MNIISIISRRLTLSEKQVQAVIGLLHEGATIPFIARYRKERTGSLDELQIAAIEAANAELEELERRKQTVLSTIGEQGALTPELRQRIDDCESAVELEDIYLPYKPHRKTRADKAREQGLQPLADLLLRQDPRTDCRREAQRFGQTEQALQGARDIIAELISIDERSRNAVRREFAYTAVIRTKPVKQLTEQRAQEADNYRDYFAVEEPLKHISSHRLLAIRRAETEGFIRVDISCDQEKALDKLARLWLRNNSSAAYEVEQAIEDCYKRLLKPAIETEFAASSKQKADEEAIRVFAGNLRQLLLESPLGQKRVLALDPGFRTGCKLVCLSAQGDLLFHTAIYPHPPVNRKSEAEAELKRAIQGFAIEAIAIGNGTASRETEAFVRDVLSHSVGSLSGKRADSKSGLTAGSVAVYIVSESGASVYSASKIAREEFPDEDVTVRGAVSIGRRLMDPLAELVKIDPKSIGVGQYQHDVDQAELKRSLDRTVESVVNYVGVDVNTASKHLLTYISGVGPVLAQNIVNYRTEHGAFPDRQALMQVPKLGAKTFEQCAGFLRIAGGRNPLDNTAVHPERYAIAAQLQQAKNAGGEVRLQDFVTDEVGLPTLQDIWRELDKPSRDPRLQIEEFHFSESVHTIDDLQEGMTLPGVVTNISNFGAFVDMGIHKDGLIHVSQLRGKSLSLHQHITVEVIAIDRNRKRISLRLK
ncbi:MAG: RNA-binding transcriptional accessory protein [Paludibacteraceae bacterium]|nr:RNA-binding transcriptional accessory protein [Paludibacteraceae bacterium]